MLYPFRQFRIMHILRFLTGKIMYQISDRIIT